MRKLFRQFWRLRRELRQAPPPRTPAEQQQQAQQRKRLRQLKRRRILPLLLLALFVCSTLLAGGEKRATPAAPVHVGALAVSAGAGAPGAASRAVPQTPQLPAGCDFTDVGCWFNEAISNFMQGVRDWWLLQVSSFTGLGIIFSTPALLSYNEPHIQKLYTFSLGVALLLLSLFLAVAGYNHLLGKSVEWSETLPKIITCALIAWGFQPLIPFFINLSNDFIGAFNAALGQSFFSGPGQDPNDPSFMGLLAFICLLIMDVLLGLEAIARLALLDVLIILAPLGIMCAALPQTRGWSRLWGEAFAATILIQPIQAVVVGVGSVFLSSLGPYLQSFGLSFPPIVQVLAGIAAFFLALRVPSLLLSRATHVVGDVQRQAIRVAAYLAS